MNKMTGDILAIASKNEKMMDDTLISLQKGLKNYATSRNINGSVARVNLLFVVAEILGWDEKEFIQMLIRLNLVMSKDTKSFCIKDLIADGIKH